MVHPVSLGPIEVGAVATRRREHVSLRTGRICVIVVDAEQERVERLEGKAKRA
jgi:hypothetical protein